MADLIVAGAGMAGLAAAAHAREGGADVLVLEKGGGAGGSMLLSSGVIWRYRDFERFRSECRDGDPVLQRLVFDRLDDDLAWLESRGAPVMERGTGNPLTTGTRFDTRGLVGTLARDLDVRLGEPLRELPDDGTPVVLATGGFQASRELVRQHVTPEAESARRAGSPVERDWPATVIETVAGVTTTLGGLRIDDGARVAPGVYACGADAGGISTGGYSSGLAAALVLGRVAAESALEERR